LSVSGDYRKKFKQASYYLIFIILIFIPLSFWKDLGNNFDLVKAAVLYVTAGLFFILSAIQILIGSKNNQVYFELIAEKKLDILFLLFFAFIIISVIFSNNPYISITGTYERQAGLITNLTVYFLFVFSPFSIKDNILKILLVMETVIVIIALYSVFSYLGLDIFNLKPEKISRPFSPAGHPIFTAGLIVLLLPFSLLNISQKKSRAAKVLFPFILFAGLIVTQTRAAYVAAALQVFLIIFLFPMFDKSKKLFFSNNLKYILPAGALIIVLVIVLIILFPENTFVKRSLSISTITEQPRWFLWKDSFRMLINYPLTGTGIGRFSNIFENFAGYELKLAEVKVYFDNAHNNFLNNFCTIGIPGGIIYIILLAYLIKDSLKNFRNVQASKKSFYLSFICCMAGYIIYGLADFDDNSIILYLFILISVYKIHKLNSFKEKSEIIRIKIKKPYNYFTATFLILFSAYLFAGSFFKISGELNYVRAKEYYSAGNFNSFNQHMKNALLFQPEQSIYRFNYAFYMFEYIVSHPELNNDIKQKLFNDAKDEVKKSIKNYNSRNECLALLSLIELEQGNTSEGFRLKEEIFKTDTCQFKYRNNLARYYLKTGKDSLALYELNVIQKHDPKNTEILSTKVLYLQNNKMYEEAINVCRDILVLKPNDQFAVMQLNRLNKLIKK